MMLRQAGLGGIFGVLLLSGLLPGVAAPAQNAAGDTVYHLHGEVVNGLTGQPLPRTLVTSGDRRLAAMTDSQGRFSIPVSVPGTAATGNGVPLGSAAVILGGPMGMNGAWGDIVLLAQKPGFTMLQERARGLALDATLDATDVQLKLMPTATIAGHVAAEGTDAARNVRVILLRHDVQDGRYRWIQAGSHNTNGRGEFRFFDLKPGEYTVMTTEWRGDQPLPKPDEIHQEYPPAFNGDTATMSPAGMLHLQYGDTPQVELHLHVATYYPVTIPVAAQGGNRGVSVRVGGNGSFGGFALGYNARDGAVEGWLPSGDYELTLSGSGQQPGSGQQQQFAEVPLHIAGAPVRMAAVALSPATSVQVHVHANTSGDSTNPVGVQVSLRSDDPGGGGFNQGGRRGREDEFAIDNVQPGSYQVSAMVAQGYVVSMSCGGVDLLTQPLVVGAGGLTDAIELTTRDDGGTVSGSVTPDAGALQPLSYVLLLPTDGSARFAQGVAGPDGQFSVTNVAPGTYRLIASHAPPWQVPFREPEAMHAFDGKGTTVTVAAGQQQQANAPLESDGGAERISVGSGGGTP